MEQVEESDGPHISEPLCISLPYKDETTTQLVSINEYKLTLQPARVWSQELVLYLQ